MSDYEIDDEYMTNDPNMGDDGALYIDFSSEEASSESRDFEPLPSGKYLVTITDVQLKASKSEKNYDKPYYAFEFTVAEDKSGGQYVGRKTWTNAMLFKPALFTITHIMKALGMSVTEGRMRIPRPEELIGQTLLIGGIKVGETQDKNDPSKKYPPKFEPKSFFTRAQWKGGTVGTVRTSAGPTSTESLLS
jgi:hypothetical protein